MTEHSRPRTISSVEAWKLITGFLSGFSIGTAKWAIWDIIQDLPQANEAELRAIQIAVVLTSRPGTEQIDIDGKLSDELLDLVRSIGQEAGAKETGFEEDEEVGSPDTLTSE
jgi:hypothetical protein